MKNHHQKIIGFVVLAVVLLVIPLILNAAYDVNSLKGMAKETAGDAIPQRNFPQLIGIIIKTILSLLAGAFIIMIIWGGITRMTAQGDAAKSGKAKQIISAAVIGLIIVLASYVIANFLIELMDPILQVERDLQAIQDPNWQ